MTLLDPGAGLDPAGIHFQAKRLDYLLIIKYLTGQIAGHLRDGCVGEIAVHTGCSQARLIPD